MESAGLLGGLGTGASIVLLGLLFALLLTLVFAWFGLPFAVFGARTGIRELLRIQEESNRLLGEIREELRASRGGPAERHGLGPGAPGGPDP